MGTNPNSTTVATSSLDHSGPGRVETDGNQPDINVVLVAGRLVHDPESRTLPSGSVAVSFSMTVRTPGEKTTSVPAVWYDPPKRVLRWSAGDDVVTQGAVVRRFFRTGAGLGSATEVVVQRGELARHLRKASAVRQRVETLLARSDNTR